METWWKSITALTLATALVGCFGKDSDDEDPKPVDACGANVICENITEDRTLTADKTWELEGFVYVQEGATLTIQPGTQIKSEGKDALIVMPGAKIMAEGTVDKPIVFTSKKADPAPGDWAGVVIFGKAPVSTPDKTQKFEAGEEKFGGDVSDDNSGVLKYVRIEYGGWEVATDKELNGLTLGGVGSGTTIEYVQVHEGSDDNFEWFGGSVNGKYLVSTGGEDDGFDIDEGYQGNGQYMIALQGPNSDRAIEAGNKAVDPNRITEATWSNMTIVANDKNEAIHVKDNVMLALSKAVIVGNNSPRLVKVEGAVALEQVTSGKTKFTNVFYTGTFDTLVVSADAAVNALLEGQLQSVAGALNADFSPKADAVKTAGAGAIVGTDLWYQGWTTGVGAFTSTDEFCTGKGVKKSDPKLVGNIASDACLSAEIIYELEGFVYVQDGATLTIQPGTQIKSEGKDALIVMPGAKIMAEGTVDKPIVFTSKKADPAPGDWAGVVIFGKAPVSTPDKTQKFEAGEEKFGGDVSDDNSGVLKYVRIEYGGWEVATDKELNGLTLGGVGSGTTIEYVQVHEGSDDNFEWFGGSVNGKYLVSTGGEDDGFDIDEGYQGNGQYMIALQGPNSDRAIEAGNKAVDPNRITEATWSNMTIVANDKNEAIHVKDNVMLALDKAVIIGNSTPTLIKVEGAVALEQVTSGKTKFTNTFYAGTFTSVVVSADAAVVALLMPMFTATTEPLNADLSPKADAVKTAEAGAIVGTNLWYSGWTKAESVKM